MVPDGSVGSMRLWRKDGVADLIYVGLSVPMIGLDSAHDVRVHAAHLTGPALHPGLSGRRHAPGADPEATPSYAFHLDLIPKVDLGAHLGYLRHCFEPLTPIHESITDDEGFSKAHLSPTQYAVMSAWMLVHRATEDDVPWCG